MAMEGLDRQKIREALSLDVNIVNPVNVVTRENPSDSFSFTVGLLLYRLASKWFIRHSRYSRPLRHSRTMMPT